MTAVITGLGVVAPTGTGADDHWAATLAGKSGIVPISRFDAAPYPVRCAGEVPDDRVAGQVPGRLVTQTDRWTQLALAGTELALRDAGVDPADLPEYDMAVQTASSSGGNEFGQREIERLWSRGPEYVGVYQSIAWFYAATTGQLSIRHGMRGPCGVVVTEQAGGLDSAAQARRVLRQGTRLVVTGGTEAPLSPYALLCQTATGRLSAHEDPARAYLPFDRTASGYVPGEGGAILIMEPAAAARNPYAVFAGHASTFDAAGPGLARAVRLALADAGLRPEQIDVVFADAAGSPDLDRAEAEVIAGIFGPRGVPVTAPKSMTGRLYAGGSALDLATACLSLRHQVLPPTLGSGSAVPGLDLVHTARDARVRAALVLARGHGGFNSAVVLVHPEGAAHG
ncbi:ketosynthase chain-length factor [Amycolatopsis sp. A133]|jgi:act minimal PKS chain-length factor (CLF/KS beta)|uniref:ketosynthase chain-length factor n=1 Tax=Amycolatopsis sp. A133 TaxID=3064472 RepID=UPI0027ED5A31|nr:ketosynthase chain-length factor [Amycolatopsis sp. A133]MDQ7803511.1 ketosynthase chain-length factor [Amycolatopsis sp. A133]